MSAEPQRTPAAAPDPGPEGAPAAGPPSAEAQLSARAHSQRGVRRWLWFMWWTVFAMVVIGGITRLTESGLSMVEWRPLMGALPPMSEAEWLEVFAKYQQTPQYQQVNVGMTLEDFKRIFFWEYFHRLFGRLIGVFFFVPFVWFLIRKRLKGRLALRVGIAFLLGGAQGLLGWFMVQSGLVDQPAVSHYRLAAHLSLAFFVGMYLIWIAWDLIPREPIPEDARPSPKLTWGFVALLAVQIVWGAFMAGKDAGHISSTFPDMNGAFMPDAVLATDAVWIVDLMENPWSIHFVHRTLGWIVVFAGIALTAHLYRRGTTALVRRTGALLAAGLVLQFLLGVLTVVLHVPIWAAVMHQGGAYVLLTIAARAAWLSRERKPLV